MMSWHSVLEPFRTIGFADVLDMAVVAALAYVVLLWFERARAAFVARGVLIVAMVYVIARQSGMHLTTWVFQGFFAIILIALVVIFQEELRSFFERVAVWSLRRRSSHPLQPKQVETLVRTIGQFAHERIGALIVLQGSDPLERHIEGGYDLDGKLSAPLLESLFDPHSEGHDGAVIIEGDRVVRFGAHLPLSKEFYRLSGMGTRHTAALGLAERTDALCIVVSEEKGAMSVAYRGELMAMDNLMLLERHLTEFLRERRPSAGRRWQWQPLLRQNAAEKVIAVVISLALWLTFVQGIKPATHAFDVPVDPQGLSEDLQLSGVEPARVRVTVTGLQRDFRLLDPASLRALLRLEAAQEGSQRILVSAEGLHLPLSLRLVSIEPSSVAVTLARAPDKDFNPFELITGRKAPKDRERP
ncbi:MAG: DNA integrity scanning protein DisA nucleotide-binding domain protein [Candidatus Omnitrophica bacterium]|nr:DNA integrity scanning protein DisA nucleotide-binding domain protein [Candidatus Omnitrophota bacterium]